MSLHKWKKWTGWVLFSFPADLNRHKVALIAGKLGTNENATDVSKDRDFMARHTGWFLRLVSSIVNLVSREIQSPNLRPAAAHVGALDLNVQAIRV